MRIDWDFSYEWKLVLVASVVLLGLAFLSGGCSKGSDCPPGYIKLDGKCYEMGAKYSKNLSFEAKV
jgi:hypothetical protein